MNRQLARNFRLVFWIQALQNVKILNIVVTLFYLHRGLSLSQVFYLSIIWSVASTSFEVPSSYLADRWGRKKTILLATVLFFLSNVVQIWSWNFNWFALSLFLYGLAFACLTGTDEALVYDTERELSIGKDSEPLKRLGHYYSAQRVFKIFAPILGALLARDLVENQYILLIVIDSLCAAVAIICAYFIIEPNHYVDLEKKEAGVFLDAFKLLKGNVAATRAIFNRSLIFIGSLILWRYFQDYFTDLQIPIIILGLAWGLAQGAMYLGNRKIHKITKYFNPNQAINWLNYLSIISVAASVVLYYYYPAKYLLLLTYLAFSIFEVLRWPLFSSYFNSLSNSYNRATTLSLASFVKGILDIPLLFIAGAIVARSPIYPYILVLLLIGLTSIIFRLKIRAPLAEVKTYGFKSSL